MSRNPPTPKWALDLIAAHTPATLQAGETFFPTKRFRSPQGQYIIRRVPKSMPGTHIPASTLSRILKGQFNAGRETLRRLKDFHKRYTYNALRAAGKPIDEARRGKYRRMLPDKLNEAIIKWGQMRDAIADSKGVDRIYVEWGMSVTGMNEKRLERYVKEKKYSTKRKPPLPPKPLRKLQSRKFVPPEEQVIFPAYDEPEEEPEDEFI